MSGARLSREEVTRLLERVRENYSQSTSDALRGHIAALEAELAEARKEQDAALADNAALVEEREQLEELLSPSVLIGYARNHPPQTRTEQNMLRWPWATLDRVAAFFARPAMPHPGAALLEDHRRALVRARNEGLERGAAWAEAIGDQGLAPAALSVAVCLRALKEPEV